MKLFPWTIQKKVETPSDVLLEQIKNKLFPPLEHRQEMGNDGQPIKFMVDYSIDSNLDAVLMDLQDGYNDRATQKTINTCVGRLNEVRRMLGAYPELDKEAKYIIVDDGSDSDVSEIKAADDR